MVQRPIWWEISVHAGCMAILWQSWTELSAKAETGNYFENQPSCIMLYELGKVFSRTVETPTGIVAVKWRRQIFKRMI